MSWIKKILNSAKQTENKHTTREEEMLIKLEESISQCEKEKKKAANEIDQIKKWAVEAITAVFQVSNKFWYDELSKYEEIKMLDENKQLDNKVLIKSDEVVYGYLEQIKLRDAKTVLYNTLIDKYSATKEKLEKIKNRSEDAKKAQTTLETLEKHSQRLDQLRYSPDNLNDHLNENNNLEMIKHEAKEVIDEFEISEEVKISLDQLNQQFNSGKHRLGAKSLIEEIEKLVDKIKKQD